MTLLALTEPIFQYVCRLNRVARAANQMSATSDTLVRTKASMMDYDSVRREVNTLLDVFLRKSRTEAELIPLARKAELALVCFIDNLIAQSKLGFAVKWKANPLALERRKEPAGDVKFFELLENTIREVDDGDKDALELLPVFYICMGLGYTGSKANDPEYLRKSMEDLGSYISPLIAADAGNMANNRITPKAYDYTDVSILSEAPSTIVKLIGVLFVCFALAVGGFYVSMYRGASKALQQSLTDIKNASVQK